MSPLTIQVHIDNRIGTRFNPEAVAHLVGQRPKVLRTENWADGTVGTVNVAAATLSDDQNTILLDLQVANPLTGGRILDLFSDEHPNDASAAFIATALVEGPLGIHVARRVDMLAVYPLSAEERRLRAALEATR